METDQVLPQTQESSAETTDQFAQRVLSELYGVIIVQESGAIAGDIEAIHDMRVAIRRLRVALSNFAVCFPRDDRRRLRERLEHLANTLGNVRDLDVLINALETARPARPAEDQPAVDALVKRLTNRRKRRHHLLINYLQSDEFRAFKAELPVSASAVQPPTMFDEKSDAELLNLQLPQPQEHGQAA